MIKDIDYDIYYDYYKITEKEIKKWQELKLVD